MTQEEMSVFRSIVALSAGDYVYVEAERLLTAETTRPGLARTLRLMRDQGLLTLLEAHSAVDGVAAAKLTAAGRRRLNEAGENVSSPRTDAEDAKTFLSGRPDRTADVGEIADAMSWDDERAFDAADELRRRREAVWHRQPMNFRQRIVGLV